MKTFFRLFPLIALVTVAAVWLVAKPLGLISIEPIPAELRGLETLSYIAVAMLVAVVLSEIVRAYREADDRKTLEGLDRRVASVEGLLRTNFEVIDFPSNPAAYRELWADFVEDYWAYNPAYETEGRPGMDLEDLIEHVFVARYKNKSFRRAYYLFLTGDKPGQEALQYFVTIMHQVKEKYPDVAGKIEVRALATKAAASEAESYRGTKSGAPVALVEMTHGGLTRGRGKPYHYLRIRDRTALDHMRDYFDGDWKTATPIDIWKTAPATGAVGAPGKD